MAVLTVPVVSLLALSAWVTVATVQDVAVERDLREVEATVVTPLREYVAAVQNERTAAARYLGDASAEDALRSSGERTATATAVLEDGVATTRSEAAGSGEDIPALMDTTLESATGVGTLREAVLARDVGWDEAYDRYTAAIEIALRLQAGLSDVPAHENLSDPHIVRELAFGREMIARSDAVVVAAGVTGTMTSAQYAELTGATTASRAFWTLVPQLRPSDAAAYENVIGSEPYAKLDGFVDSIIAAGPGDDAPAAVNAQDWDDATDAVLAGLTAAEDATTTRADAQAGFFPLDVLRTGGLAVVLGLVGVILSLLISVYIGRGLLVELAGLRDAAMDLATRKLPDALRRLNAGETVDIDAEAPRTGHRGGEVGQVNEALNAVHRSAINAAIDRSQAVAGISSVYVDLARRSQVLLHRQLGLLDAMERRIEDPQDLEDLFRLDHLTTRMRRQAESLIILSGASPARRWRYPVPAIDVVRAAVAEIEDFTRVEVQDMPDVRVTGAFVADLTHLIAELVENAVTFSPPHTKALVRGQLVGSGLAVEIEDRGLGMSQQALADANKRVQDEGRVDLLEADQLGLFVVNRLAHRQKIKVTLERSPYGGVTAVALIPDRLLDRDGVPADRLASDSPGSDRSGGDRQHGGHDSPWRVISPDGGSAASSNGSTPAPSAAPEEGTTRTDRGATPGAKWRTYTVEIGAQPAAGDAAHPAGTHETGDTPSLRPDSGGEDDLPRRVRQANLAPELREDEPVAAVAPAAEQGRTPEQARATLEALRTGWLRGRDDTDQTQGDER